MKTGIETATDEELARQAQAGSSDAFESLVCRYERRVYAFVVQHLPGRTDAREVTQDTFVRAFQAIARFDPRRAFAPWLFTIARRKCIDRYRAARPISDELAPEMIDLNTPDEALANNEERAALWALARKHLPQLQYEALWLKYAEEMDVAQVAQVLGKTRIHIKVLLFRARQTLGLLLKSAAVSAADHRHSLSPAKVTREPACPPVAPHGFISLPGRNELL